MAGCSSNKTLSENKLKEMRTEIDGLREENKKLEVQCDELKTRLAEVESDQSARSERLNWILTKLPEIKSKIVYITDFDQQSNTLKVNEIEWVTTKERVDELEIKADMSNGFYIYDKENKEEEIKLSFDFRCNLLDEASLVSKSQSDFYEYLKKEAKEKVKYPFILYMVDGEIIEVNQHYLP